MKRLQMCAAIAGPQSTRHGANDRAVVIRLDWAVATKDPDDVRGVSIARPEPSAVRLCVFRREDLWPRALLDIPLVAPCRQETDVQPERSRLVHHEIDLIPV